MIQATTSDAAAAVAELEKHTQICTGEAQVAANGFKIERGGYIEVGADRLEFNPDYQGELIVGDGDITFGEYETDIRDYFLYKKGEASREDQIRLYLPKNSYLSLGGKSVRLTEDVLVEINGLADGYDILDASDATVLQKMFEAKSGSELLVASDGKPDNQIGGGKRGHCGHPLPKPDRSIPDQAGRIGSQLKRGGQPAAECDGSSGRCL